MTCVVLCVLCVFLCMYCVCFVCVLYGFKQVYCMCVCIVCVCAANTKASTASYHKLLARLSCSVLSNLRITLCVCIRVLCYACGVCVWVFYTVWHCVYLYMHAYSTYTTQSTHLFNALSQHMSEHSQTRTMMHVLLGQMLWVGCEKLPMPIINLPNSVG